MTPDTNANTTSNAKPNFALLGDSPVLEAGRGDHLDFDKTAQVLAGAAVQTKDPLTIGVFGEWGSGKTSLMRLMKKVIETKEEYRDVVPVWFNAWQYEREEHLIVPLVATIIKELKKKNGGDSASQRFRAELIPALRAVAYGFSADVKGKIPFLGEAGLSASGKEIIERFQELTKDSILGQSLHFDAFDELTAVTKQVDKKNEKKRRGQAKAKERDDEDIQPPRVVVFVDDLDRCDPSRAVELLEHIKLVLHQPGFAFVLGVHAQIVETVIREKYAKEYKLDPKFAKDYLHKIAQVQIHVPTRDSQEMAGYISRLLSDANVEFSAADKNAAIPLIADICGHNPRSIVRTLNGLIVMSKIAELEDKEREKKRDISLLALVIDVATRELERFRGNLDLEVSVDDKKTTIGAYLADRLKEYKNDHEGWSTSQSEGAEKLKSPSLVNALTTLKDHENLCRPLKSETGQRWLRDKEFRETLGEARKRTGSEPEKETPPAATGDLIGELRTRGMVPIKAGTFQMGSEKGEEREKRVHSVTLDSFEISATPITQAQYAAVMGENPSRFKGERNPVELVTWNDAMEFCEKLSNMAGQRFTLPTEAQWEYACRAGTTTEYSFGDEPKDLEQYGWYDGNSNGMTHPVGEKKPNPWGLYDMHGNVWEWCADWHGEYPSKPQTNPKGPDSGQFRVLRGGSWGDYPGGCRSAARLYAAPGHRSYSFGFRVVRTP